MMRTFRTRPYVVNNEEGLLLQAFEARIKVKATCGQTGGAFNLFEVTCPAGYATPMHIHYAEDVAVYVLDGTLTFFWGSEKKEVKSGAFAYQPRGTPHGFRVEGGTPAQILYLTIPAGFDQFVMEQDKSGTRSEAEMEAARYKIEILGPLPE